MQSKRCIDCENCGLAVLFSQEVSDMDAKTLGAFIVGRRKELGLTQMSLLNNSM